MISLNIPRCPECGELAEDVGDGEIYCEPCYREFIHWLLSSLGQEGLNQLCSRVMRDKILGIGLDCQPLEVADDEMESHNDFT